MALIPLLRLDDLGRELSLTIALSLALDIAVAIGMLYAGLWSPSGGLLTLITICLAGATTQFLIAQHRARSASGRGAPQPRRFALIVLGILAALTIGGLLGIRSVALGGSLNGGGFEFAKWIGVAIFCMVNGAVSLQLITFGVRTLSSRSGWHPAASWSLLVGILAALTIGGLTVIIFVWTMLTT